jgi:LmbE family N-acetylglucosaminyl deacetylase
MFSLSVNCGHEPLRSLLVVGCHSDDIEIGCGGTILTLTRNVPDLRVTWVVLAADEARAQEARSSADAFLASAGSASVEVHGFRDGFLPYLGAAVKDVFEELKQTVEPQLVITHMRDDLHQDHRLASDLTRETFRDHLILEYEIPKVDGDLGRPNVYVGLTSAIASEKVALLHEHHQSQVEKHWFDHETFLGLMRLRGMEGVAPERYAEAFTCRRLVITHGVSAIAAPSDTDHRRAAP